MIILRTKEYLYKVCEEFFDVTNIIDIKELTSGNINETYVIVFPKCRYILQLLNAHVYYSPIGVMNNTRLIVDHIRKKCIYRGYNAHNTVLNFIKTKYNQDLAIIDHEYWRCSEYIENSYSLEKVNNIMDFHQIGKAIGNFQDLLSDFPAKVLDDTIKHFHDTPYRYNNFLEVVKLDKYDRVKEALEEISFIKERSNKLGVIMDLLKEGKIPCRVTHNDTKASNVLLDKNTNEFLCLIDLDTVMKGSLLFDYGDALRFGASVTTEDDENLDRVDIDLKWVKFFTKGFFEELNINNINGEEIKHLYDGLWVITIELAMRFLQDYLEGDHYFRTSKEKHNLIRAKNQLQLLRKIEEKEFKIKQIISEVIKNT